MTSLGRWSSSQNQDWHRGNSAAGPDGRSRFGRGVHGSLMWAERPGAQGAWLSHSAASISDASAT